MNEVRISPSELRKALAFAASVTERRNTIPVLGMVKIDIAKPASTITRTDLDMEAVAEFETADLTGGPFSFLISPRLLSDVTRFAEDLITISKADDILTIKADDMTVQAREICAVEDWPASKLPGFTGGAGFTEAVLHKALRAVIPSISNEVTRYYLNGAFFCDSGDGNLTIVSTDGHRLSRYETGQPWVQKAKMILPRKACQIIFGKMASGGNKSVQIEARGDLQMIIKGDDWSLRSKCIDGTYPDYTRVIPAPADAISFTLTAAALRRFPKTEQRSPSIKIQPGAGKMSITNADGMTATMPVTGKGADCGFNLAYLKTFADLSGTIKVSGSGHGDPFRVLSEDPALTQVLMPMRV